MDKRQYIHPKEMDFIYYVLRNRKEFNPDVIDWYFDRVMKRLEILKPLVIELKEKDILLKTVCADLNVEYSDLLFIDFNFRDLKKPTQ